MTEEEWDAVINVHLKGTFAPAHFAAAYWRDQSKAGKRERPRSINTTSVSGIYGNPGQTNYGAAKAGIAAFTVIAALELASLRRDRQRRRAGRPHPDDRGARAGAGDRRAARCPRRRAGSPRSSPGSPRTSRPASRGGSSRRRARCSAIAEGWRRGPRVDPIDDPDPARTARRATARRHSSQRRDGRRAGLVPPAVELTLASSEPSEIARSPTQRKRARRMPLNPDSVGTRSEAAGLVMDEQGRPALRRQPRCRHRRAGVHHGEHQRRRPAGAADVPRRDPEPQRHTVRRHRLVQPGDARPRNTVGHPAADRCRPTARRRWSARSPRCTTRRRPPSS